MKTVLTTGACRGLGYEAARQLSERGWKVILTARRKDQGSVYLNFTDVEAGSWGWNGSTFG